jgi:hypothetical protein
VLGTAQGSFALLKYLSPLADIMQGLFFRFAVFFSGSNLPGVLPGHGEPELQPYKNNRTRTTSWQSRAIALLYLRGYPTYRLLSDPT